MGEPAPVETPAPHTEEGPTSAELAASNSDDSPVEPTEEALARAVDEILEEQHGLGVAKLLKQLKVHNTDWKLSEKRLRHFMKDRPRSAARPTPVSRNDVKLLDLLREAAPALELKRIDQHKGRGIFAKDDIKEGAVLFQEDAWVFVPTGLVAERMYGGFGCSHCGKVFQTGRPTNITCTFHAASSKSACRSTFCTRTCQTAHTQAYGAFTCAAVNSAYAELVEISQETTVPLVIFKIIARIVVAYGRSAAEGAVELARAEAFTGISERTRREQSMTSEEIADQLEAFWRIGFETTLKALHLEALDAAGDQPSGELPAAHGNGNGIAHVSSSVPQQLRMTRPLPINAAKSLLSYDAYLLMHGRVSLNREDDGGLYILHSSLNHACAPNVILKRTATKGAQRSRILSADIRPSRIYIWAARDIAAGEEIMLTYVDPSEKVHARRTKLLADYLFLCQCSRCEHELSEDRQLKRMINMIQSLNGGNAVTATVKDGMTIFQLNGDKDTDKANPAGEDLAKVVAQAQAQNVAEESAA